MDNRFCLELHKLVSKLPLYSVDTLDDIPFINGIYFVFEKSEKYHGYRRIVRVGTHTKDDGLKNRLSNHFVKTSKSSSIFLKNIGRTYLNIEDKDYVEIWNIKRDRLKSKEEQILYDAKRDKVKEKYYEAKASKYIRDNMTVSVIKMKNDRERYENAIIATLSHTDDFKCSPNWFGKNSPEECVRKSGMWLYQGLNQEPLTQEEMDKLKEIIQETYTIYNI